jgi:hypothetical protein
MAHKKLLKIILGTVVFITLPSLLLLGFLYYKNHRTLPTGTEGVMADQLATKMLMALNYEAFVGTDYIEWTFKNKRHYKWHKAKKTCEVHWKDYKINLDLKTPEASKAYVHGFTIQGDLGQSLVKEARDYFHNDVFWLTAPFNVFKKGTKRAIVTETNGQHALLITNSDNSAYLWHFTDNGIPKSCNMWDDKTPIQGLEAIWQDWQVIGTGAKLPKFHKVLYFGMEISDVKTE